MKTIITAILIIVAVAAVLFFLPLIIMFFSYVWKNGMCLARVAENYNRWNGVI